MAATFVTPCIPSVRKLRFIQPEAMLTAYALSAISSQPADDYRVRCAINRYYRSGITLRCDRDES